MIIDSLKDLMKRNEDDKIILRFDRFEAQKEDDQTTMSGVIELGGESRAEHDGVSKLLENKTGGIGERPIRVIGRAIEFILSFDCKKGVGTIKIMETSR